MKTKYFLAAALTAVLPPVVGGIDVAHAQSFTTGALQGVVTDSQTGEKLPGVTVIASSAKLQQPQTAITDENGSYKISDLPPGDYLVTFYFADITLERSGISVGINKVTPVFQKLNQQQAGGEVVKIIDTPPVIDPTSTTQGITIDRNYLRNIPTPGRTFESALGAAAGSQGDSQGVSFSGSSSLENQYFVDGVNTTGLTYGTIGSPVINDFIEEIEVITGGYNAEFGRATGGIVNVVTKSGSNEFKGSVFGTYQPGWATAGVERTPVNAASIDIVQNIDYNIDFGFEVGGPIIKDKLWFYVGFVPQLAKASFRREIKRQTDCRQLQATGQLSECNPALPAQNGFADGAADIDPETGFYITDIVDTSYRSAKTTAYNILAKLNYAATPEHQGSMTLQALPGNAESPGLYGPASSGYKIAQLTTDLSAKWTSKFNDNKTEIEAIVGWHRDFQESDAYTPELGNTPRQVLRDGSLGTWAQGFMTESPAAIAGCRDAPPGPNSPDPYPYLETNCPMDTLPYVLGGPGFVINDTEQRQMGRVTLTQRVKAAGNHEIKAGMDVENNYSDKTRLYTGGALVTNYVGGGVVAIDRYVALLGREGSPIVEGNTNPRYDRICTTPSATVGGVMGSTDRFVCDYIDGVPGDPGTIVKGNTLNWSAFLRDSWQIQPNLTFNVGIRYEEQRMRYADFLQNTVDPLTQERLGTNAMVMKNMIAPRLGLLYDWTKEGRSKIYAHWGRFYESIPMNINDRSFGGEVTYQQQFAAAQCGPNDPRIGGPDGVGCIDDMGKTASSQRLVGASGVLIAPDLKPQYMDELIGGFEYEILDDLKIGVAYQNRRMGRVIEDVSTDGANTYIIANPGEWSTEAEDDLETRIANTDDPDEAARLSRQLNLFRGIRVFDKPRRDYSALQFTMTRRFSKALYVQGSYTFSRTTGNYPGLVSYDNGQVDPNISSQYDLIELLSNRIGPLPQDRPHYIKLDGYYTFDFKKAGALTTGIRLRALSGVPQNALAGHYLYGPNEAFLLPRGQLGRSDFEHGLDIHLGYARDFKVGKNPYKFEVYFDLYNIYNRQGQAGIDDNFAPQFKLAGPNSSAGTIQNANPVAGGTYEDLIWVKTIDNNGNESSTPIGKNPNYGNTNSRYAPAYGRVGVRLTF